MTAPSPGRGRVAVRRTRLSPGHRSRPSVRPQFVRQSRGSRVRRWSGCSSTWNEAAREGGADASLRSRWRAGGRRSATVPRVPTTIDVPLPSVRDPDARPRGTTGTFGRRRHTEPAMRCRGQQVHIIGTDVRAAGDATPERVHGAGAAARPPWDTDRPVTRPAGARRPGPRRSTYNDVSPAPQPAPAPAPGPTREAAHLASQPA